MEVSKGKKQHVGPPTSQAILTTGNLVLLFYVLSFHKISFDNKISGINYSL